MASLKSSKSRQKQGIDLQPFQIFKTTSSVFYFKLGIGKLVESFQSKFIVPRYLKYFVSRDKDTPAFLKAILEELDLRGKLNSSEIP